MKMPWTRKSIVSFIKTHGINELDFETTHYRCFNDFFTRKISPEARPIAKTGAIVPCDGRHLFFQNLSEKNSFYVKGQTLSLEKLLDDTNLSQMYSAGSMIISRLAPVDYHRFHFPADAHVKSIRPIKGSLFSVNPIALKEMVQILTENKRVVVETVSKEYGNVVHVLVGATNVGSIHFTARENTDYKKGDELGFFSFGGSMMITLFQRDAIVFNKKIVKLTAEQTECLLNLGTGLESTH